MTRRRGVAVIGLGNVVCSDDGVGVHALARLRARGATRPDVELVEGGTAGLLLLPHLAGTRRALVLDAVDAGLEPGTLVRLDGEDIEGATARATTHDVGLRDLLAAARMTGGWPDELVLHGVQPACTAVGTELTPAVAAALDRLVDRAWEQLRDWGAA
jgi:hydrogenase maturation protease